jgi:linoleoyl-CoA desaturase
MHIMTGNLSHQIEHHLFPDLPSNRYAEIAPRIRDLFDRYGLNYHTAPLPKQVGSAWHKIIRLSLPNGWLQNTTARNLPSQLGKLWKMTTGSRKERRLLMREQAMMAAA